MASPMIILYGMIIGALTLLLFYLFGLMSYAAPPPPPPPPPPPQPQQNPSTPPVVIKKRSEAELSEQRERCENVRERCAPAAKVINLLSSSHQILEYHERAPDQDEKAALKEALGVLQKIIDENDGDGALGAIASTELCNVMLAADGLNSLDKLKNHPDSDIATQSCAILQFIVPRIWSC